MAHRVCPFWIGYLLLSPFRKLFQNPNNILKPFLEPGFTALDFGSAMGYFSIPMAKLVQPEGKVICIDIQEKMLNVLLKRAKKASVDKFIETCIATQKSAELEKYYNSVDFVLAFAVAHEVPDQNYLFKELSNVLKPGGKLLFSEPSSHVSESDFQNSVNIALQNNFSEIEPVNIRRSRSVLFNKV